ncbi:unnamed protein product [Heligmosomoides polygyrus]|uniref:ADH_zinc_N domain-containing protein n=1 Tax=Heligmosomoides polygyrus TaxID=6339 RepID=A0A183GEW0_HELPZ|nr:unnamed protein product [Heligmosomoides polygyrus]
MMRETDKYGVLLGLTSVAVKYFCRSFKSALRGRWFSYAFFRPNQECMLQLTKFAEEGMVVPIVEKVMSFEQLPAAYEKVSALHGRGKTVLVW